MIAHPGAIRLAESLAISPDQLGMKLGKLTGALFPLVVIPLYRHLWKTQDK